jgi:CIC family chloride channel protein
MVIGGFTGAAIWRRPHGGAPVLPHQPGAFVVVGMIACFGSIAHAPLAVMLMVAEMTGNLSLLAPAMVAVALSTALVGDNTIYTSQLPNRASSPAHRIRFSFPLLSSLYARDAMVPVPMTVGPDTPLADIELRDGEVGESLPVVDDHKRLLGIVPARELHHVARHSVESTRARAVMNTSVPAIPADEPLDLALEHLTESEQAWLPVVDGDRLVGRLSARNAIAAYRRGLQRGVRRATSLPPNTVLVQQRIGDDSVLAGTELREARLPAHTLVVSVTREGETLFPRGTMRLQSGDDLMVMTEPSTEDCLRALLAGTDMPDQREQL